MENLEMEVLLSHGGLTSLGKRAGSRSMWTAWVPVLKREDAEVWEGRQRVWGGRQTVSLNGFKGGDLKSWLQKCIRRGRRAEMEHCLVELLSIPSEHVRSNFLNRLKVCAVEDVGLGDPDAVMRFVGILRAMDARRQELHDVKGMLARQSRGSSSSSRSDAPLKMQEVHWDGWCDRFRALAFRMARCLVNATSRTRMLSYWKGAYVVPLANVCKVRAAFPCFYHGGGDGDDGDSDDSSVGGSSGGRDDCVEDGGGRNDYVEDGDDEAKEMELLFSEKAVTGEDCMAALMEMDAMAVGVECWEQWRGKGGSEMELVGRSDGAAAATPVQHDEMTFPSALEEKRHQRLLRTAYAVVEGALQPVAGDSVALQRLLCGFAEALARKSPRAFQWFGVIFRVDPRSGWRVLPTSCHHGAGGGEGQRHGDCGEGKPWRRCKADGAVWTVLLAMVAVGARPRRCAMMERQRRYVWDMFYLYRTSFQHREAFLFTMSAIAALILDVDVTFGHRRNDREEAEGDDMDFVMTMAQSRGPAAAGDGDGAAAAAGGGDVEKRDVWLATSWPAPHDDDDDGDCQAPEECFDNCESSAFWLGSDDDDDNDDVVAAAVTAAMQRHLHSREMVLELPDDVLDGHTTRGRKRQRGGKFFATRSARVLNGDCALELGVPYELVKAYLDLKCHGEILKS